MYLPAYQELDKEQDAVLNLPLDGRYMVIGPPGSGKTVVALHRAARFKRRKQKIELVTFSRVLSQYIEDAADELDLATNTKTYVTWFKDFYKKTVGGKPKEHAAFEYDWADVFQKFAKANPSRESLPNVFLDEAQDLPKAFFSIIGFLAKNVTVFADENQRITDSQSTIDEIMSFGMIPAPFHVLRKNYRNTLEIAKLAAEFYCGLRSGIPDLPDRRGEKPVVERFDKTHNCIETIVRYEANNSDRRIGILVPRRDILKKYLNRLEGKTRKSVQCYVGGDEYRHLSTPLDFSRPGITLLCYQSAKGLEFDTVFLPEIQSASKLSNLTDDLKMKMYVAMSRAREDLFISYVGQPDNHPAWLDVIPKDLVTWKGR